MPRCHEPFRERTSPMTRRFQISIALATYQSERYLKEQLESYATQTHLPDELIISDDNSTDNTPTIIEDFKRNAPFPISFVINSRDRGKIQWNFENAVRRCTGEVIL